MKIRTGFVSNSSSSSFIVFGTYNIDGEKVDHDLLEKHKIEYYESDEDGPCVGVDPSEMKSDETLAQFQTRIAERLNLANIKVEPKELSFTGGSFYN